MESAVSKNYKFSRKLPLIRIFADNVRRCAVVAQAGKSCQDFPSNVLDKQQFLWVYGTTKMNFSDTIIELCANRKLIFIEWPRICSGCSAA